MVYHASTQVGANSCCTAARPRASIVDIRPVCHRRHRDDDPTGPGDMTRRIGTVAAQTKLPGPGLHVVNVGVAIQAPNVILSGG
jgi:hypothetical protein